MTATRLEKLIAIVLLYTIALFINFVIHVFNNEAWAITFIITMLILTTKSRKQ